MMRLHHTHAHDMTVVVRHHQVPIPWLLVGMWTCCLNTALHATRAGRGMPAQAGQRLFQAEQRQHLPATENIR
jgi:hypothetical protein